MRDPYSLYKIDHKSHKVNNLHSAETSSHARSVISILQRLQFMQGQCCLFSKDFDSCKVNDFYSSHARSISSIQQKLSVMQGRLFPLSKDFNLGKVNYFYSAKTSSHARLIIFIHVRSTFSIWQEPHKRSTVFIQHRYARSINSIQHRQTQSCKVDLQ